jgi:Tol biopolymer transport system component/DNA-binding winged helix-turn-helix (wHTH) protein
MEERIARFGVFEVDVSRRELRREGRLVPLQDQPLSLLLALLEHPGEEVSREQLRLLLWPDQAFLEFDTGINTAVAKLRQALGDSAESPRFIATRPRRGYRFIAPVTFDDRSPSQPRAAGRSRGQRLKILTAASIAAVVSAAGAWLVRPSPSGASVMFAVAPPTGLTFSTSGGFMAISPDGRYLAFVASDDRGRDTLWLRAMDSLVARVVPGTEGAYQPFWAADNRHIAFFSGGKLRKTDIAGGAVQTICDASIGSVPLAGTWNSDGVILFSAVRRDIVRVSADGGVPVPLVTRESSDEAVSWPQFLPDGQHFLYMIDSADRDRAGIYVGALDSPRRVRIASDRSSALYAAPGRLVFIRDGSLVSQRFDLRRMALTGSAIPIAENVAYNAGTARGVFSASQTGVITYRTVADSQLVWMDRTGRRLATVGMPGEYLHFALAPDGMQVAAARVDPHTGTSHIWVIDADTGRERRLTFGPARQARPLWSRDGRSITFGSSHGGRWEIYETPASGDNAPRLLLSSVTSVSAQDRTADGRVLFEHAVVAHKGELRLGVPTRRVDEAVQLPYVELDQGSARLSPDDRWLAYRGYESDWRIFVRPADASMNRWQISEAVDHESAPRWRGDGRELYYLARDLSVMAVSVEPGMTFNAGAPRALFRTGAVAPSGVTGEAYDVSPDGQRFLVKVPASFSPITVVVNWWSAGAGS